MSMIYILRHVSDSALCALWADPPLIEQFLDPTTEVEPRKPGFLARLLGAKESAASPLSALDSSGAENDLDKAWHGIHFLLCGSD